MTIPRPIMHAAGELDSTAHKSPRQMMWRLNALHFFNDGYQAALHWMLPLLAVAGGLSEMRWGVMASAHMFLGVVLCIPAGVAARRWGGERLLYGSMLVYGFAFTLLGFGTNEWQLWLVMLLAGLGFGVFHPVGFGVVAALSHSANGVGSGGAMGRFAAIGDVGRVFFSWLFVGMVASVGLTGSAAGVGIAAMLAAVVCLMRHQSNEEFTNDDDSAPGQDSNSSTCTPGAGLSVRTKMARVARNRKFLMATGMGTCDGLVTTGLIMFTPLMLSGKGYEGFWLSLFVALLYGGSLFGKVAVGMAADHWGNRVALAVCQVALTVVVVSLAFSQSLVLDGLLVGLLGMLTKGCLPITLSLTASSLTKENLPIGFGVNQTITGLAAAASPSILGFLSGSVGLEISSIIMAGTSCSMIVILLLIDRRWDARVELS